MIALFEKACYTGDYGKLTEPATRPVTRWTQELAEVNLEPFWVQEEDAPIVSMDLVQAIAQAYDTYWVMATCGEHEKRLRANLEHLPQVIELEWRARAEATEAVRQREIPVVGNQPVVYCTHSGEKHGSFIGRSHYFNNHFSLERHCLGYTSALEQGDFENANIILAELNFILFSIGFVGLLSEVLGHDGLHRYIRSGQLYDTIPPEDTSAQEAWFVEASKISQSFREWCRLERQSTYDVKYR